MAHRHAKLYRQNGSRFISIDLGTVDGKRFRRVARSPEYDGGENWFEAGRRTTSMREATGWTADYIELAEAMENGTPTASKLTRALVAEYMAERSKKSPSTVAKARQITTEILADFEGRAVRSISIHTTRSVANSRRAPTVWWSPSTIDSPPKRSFPLPRKIAMQRLNGSLARRRAWGSTRRESRWRATVRVAISPPSWP